MVGKKLSNHPNFVVGGVYFSAGYLIIHCGDSPWLEGSTFGLLSFFQAKKKRIEKRCLHLLYP